MGLGTHKTNSSSPDIVRILLTKNHHSGLNVVFGDLANLPKLKVPVTLT